MILLPRQARDKHRESTQKETLRTPAGGNGPPLDLFQQHNEWFYPHDDPLEYGQLCWGNASLVGKKTAGFCPLFR